MTHAKRYETVVLIPSFNGRTLLEDCLKALGAQTYADFKVVIADDASTDDSREYVATHFPHAEFLSFPKNRGFARTVNAGLSHIREKYNPLFAAILNNDTRADKEWLGALVKVAKQDMRIAAVTSNMLLWSPPHLVNSQGGTLDWNGDGYDINFGLTEEKGAQCDTDVLGACWGASLIRVSALEDIGPLDAAFGAYFEDLDWSWRANILGYRVVFAKDARIFHRHSASYRKAKYRKLFFCKRNALRTALKNYETKNLPKQLSRIFLGYWFSIVGYLETSRHQLSFPKKIAYISIPFAALLWNIIHLPGTLRARRTIQRKRKRNDAFCSALIAHDTTPIKEWMTGWRRRFRMPLSEEDEERGSFLSYQGLQAQYGLPRSEIRALEAAVFLFTEQGLFDDSGGFSPLLGEIDDKTLTHFFNIALLNLPFLATTMKREEINTLPSALVIDACLFSFGLSVSAAHGRFSAAAHKIDNAVKALRSHTTDWDGVLAYAHTHNALSQLYFYCSAIEHRTPGLVPSSALQATESGGSRIQNAIIQRICFGKLLKGEPSLALRAYLAMYFTKGVLRALVTHLHAYYNGEHKENEPRPFGINLFGFLDSESGVGEAARTLARAVKRTRILHALINSPHAPHRRKETQFSKEFAKGNPYAVNLIAIYGDMFASEWNYFGEEAFAGRYNIAYWTWELETLPPAWIPLLDRVDEVWAVSSFAAKAIEATGKKLPVTIVPHAIEVKKFSFPRAHFGIPPDAFVFLFMFDFYSYFERKNPLAVIRAFERAFPDDKGVSLIIKCSNSSVDKEHFEELKRAAHDPRIRIMDTYLEREEVSSLMSVCDAYISLHRSEGFGLTMAEAMALRKPVIATYYSSNTDFMNEENSFPVRYSLVPIEKDYGPYTRGNRWAEPDVAHAAEQMRTVYENPDLALRKAMFGMHTIATRFSPGAVAEIVGKRLRELQVGGLLSLPQKEITS